MSTKIYRKSQDFQSTGASINITAELDSSLLSRPEELQRSIANLYQQARIALDRQTAASPPSSPQTVGEWTKGRELDTAPLRPNGHNGKPYNGNGNGNGHGPRPMTDRQRKALLAIGRSERVDVFASARSIFGRDFNDLASSEASSLIDRLKATAVH